MQKTTGCLKQLETQEEVVEDGNPAGEVIGCFLSVTPDSATLATDL